MQTEHVDIAVDGLQPHRPSCPRPLHKFRRHGASAASMPDDSDGSSLPWTPLLGSHSSAKMVPVPPSDPVPTTSRDGKGLKALRRPRQLSTRPRNVFNFPGMNLEAASSAGEEEPMPEADVGAFYFPQQSCWGGATWTGSSGSEIGCLQQRRPQTMDSWSTDWAFQNSVPFRYRFLNGWPADLRPETSGQPPRTSEPHIEGVADGDEISGLPTLERAAPGDGNDVVGDGEAGCGPLKVVGSSSASGCRHRHGGAKLPPLKAAMRFIAPASSVLSSRRAPV